MRPPANWCCAKWALSDFVDVSVCMHGQATHPGRWCHVRSWGDTVAKVESCISPDFWWNLKTRAGRRLALPQSRYRSRLWVLRDAIRSLRSLHENCACGPQNFDTFGKTTFATLSPRQRTSPREAHRAGLHSNPTFCNRPLGAHERSFPNHSFREFRRNERVWGLDEPYRTWFASAFWCTEQAWAPRRQISEQPTRF